MTLLDAVEEHLREKFGACTIVFSGSRVAGLDRPSSDIDALVIGSHHGTYFTRVADVFVDVELYNEATFPEQVPSVALITKLLLYPAITHGNDQLIEDKRYRMAASLPQSHDGIIEAFHQMGHGYRVRRFAILGILEQRLSYIHDLQKHEAIPQPVIIPRLGYSPERFSQKFTRCLAEILTNALHASAKIIGVLARRAEDLHWASYDSPVQAAYGTTLYAKASDVLHELQRTAFHRGLPQILRGEDVSYRMLRELTQVIRP